MTRKIKKAAVLICFFIYNRIVSLFMPVKKDLIIFCSETGGTLTGNLRCIYEYLENCDYVRHVYTKGDRRDGEKVKGTLALWKDLSVAGYIILDDFYTLTSAMKVRYDQELIQVWHGAGAFKKFGFSRIGTGDNIKNINGGYRKYTKVITSSEEIRPLYAEAFNIPEEKVLATGSPRTDVFFDESWRDSAKKNIYKQYPELENKKIVLFAPTYRGRKVEDADYNFEYADLNRLQRELGKEYAIVTRWHPALQRNIKKGIKESSNCEDVLDVSEYDDVNELLIAADILVTDYSSIIFDYYFANKPVVYFVYDLEEYEGNRGLYYDFIEYVYGTIAYEREQLSAAIKREEMCIEKRKRFGERFLDACDGKSTEKTVEYILGEKI